MVVSCTQVVVPSASQRLQGKTECSVADGDDSDVCKDTSALDAPAVHSQVSALLGQCATFLLLAHYGTSCCPVHVSACTTGGLAAVLSTPTFAASCWCCLVNPNIATIDSWCYCRLCAVLRCVVHIASRQAQLGEAVVKL